MRQRKTDVPVRARVKGDKTYLDAERDFVYNGLEIDEIAKKYDLPKNTVAHWHYAHCWIAQRLKYNREINNRLFEHTAQQSCEILQVCFSMAKEGLIDVCEAIACLRSLKSEDDKEPVIIKNIGKYKELYRLAKDIISLYSLAKPDISQDQGERLIASVNKVKEEIVKAEEDKEQNANV